MCGIAGVIYKDKKTHPVGKALTSMLESLQHRGPDSAGYSIYGSLNFPENYYQLNIEVKRKRGTLEHLKSLLTQMSPIYEEQLIESVGDSDVYKCKIALDDYSLLKPCIGEIDELENVRVINGSHSFEMIKPYQSYIIPDITVVHNGQITNYWKIRDPLERKGHTFESFNDTECIVHYMADKLNEGYKLEEALDQAVIDLDGPFSILVGTPNGIGIAKDKLGLRPGVMVETDEIFAVASEEMALHNVTDSDKIEQIAPGETRAYTI